VESNYAGIAFGNAGVGAVHSLSYPLGGNYHVPHGEANYQFFTEVFKTYNRLKPDGKIKEINRLLAAILKSSDVSNIYTDLEKFLGNLIPKNKLRTYGMKDEEKVIFTDSVIEKQQRLLGNNYVFLSRDEILNIYSTLY
jgi:4-hydroxybutyrate dehydrogenase